jgi:hypothetical protein
MSRHERREHSSIFYYNSDAVRLGDMTGPREGHYIEGFKVGEWIMSNNGLTSKLPTIVNSSFGNTNFFRNYVTNSVLSTRYLSNITCSETAVSH